MSTSIRWQQRKNWFVCHRLRSRLFDSRSACCPILLQGAIVLDTVWIAVLSANYQTFFPPPLFVLLLLPRQLYYRSWTPRLVSITWHAITTTTTTISPPSPSSSCPLLVDIMTCIASSGREVFKTRSITSSTAAAALWFLCTFRIWKIHQNFPPLASNFIQPETVESWDIWLP